MELDRGKQNKLSVFQDMPRSDILLKVGSFKLRSSSTETSGQWVWNHKVGRFQRSLFLLLLWDQTMLVSLAVILCKCEEVGIVYVFISVYM